MKLINMTKDKIEIAAEKYAESIGNIDGTAIFDWKRGALSPEAKEYWQQGMYSEEDVKRLILSALKEDWNLINPNEWFELNKNK